MHIYLALDRPPGREVESITDLRSELLDHGKFALGTTLVGDMNVHERAWLRHSQGSSVEGKELRAVAQYFGMRQFVHEPTRGDNLLDLVLSDLENVSCSVKPKIADHNGVLVTLTLAVPLSSSFKRTVWCYQQADWKQLYSALEMYDWSLIDALAVDDSSLQFSDTILEAGAARIAWINAALALLESKRKAMCLYHRVAKRSVSSNHCATIVQLAQTTYLRTF